MLSKLVKALCLALLILISVTVIALSSVSLWLSVVQFFETIFHTMRLSATLLALWDIIVKAAVVGITWYLIFLVWTRPIRRSVRGTSRLPFNRRKK